MRSRGTPWATRTSRIHRWTAVGSQKMTCPHPVLAATRWAQAVSLGEA
jgi:hypothetical protein